jgi:hypothetical protein
MCAWIVHPSGADPEPPKPARKPKQMCGDGDVFSRPARRQYHGGDRIHDWRVCVAPSHSRALPETLDARRENVRPKTEENDHGVLRTRNRRAKEQAGSLARENAATDSPRSRCKIVGANGTSGTTSNDAFFTRAERSGGRRWAGRAPGEIFVRATAETRSPRRRTPLANRAVNRANRARAPKKYSRRAESGRGIRVGQAGL